MFLLILVIVYIGGIVCNKVLLGNYLFTRIELSAILVQIGISAFFVYSIRNTSLLMHIVELIIIILITTLCIFSLVSSGEFNVSLFEMIYYFSGSTFSIIIYIDTLLASVLYGNLNAKTSAFIICLFNFYTVIFYFYLVAIFSKYFTIHVIRVTTKRTD